MNDILLRIKGLLEEKEISENAFTKEIGIAQSTYNTWVQKDRVPSAKWLPVIADYFEVSIDYLMHGVADSESPMTDDAKKMRERYALILKKMNLKNADVVRATGIPASTLSEWKKGKYELGMDKIVAIAEFLGVSLDYFVSGYERDSNELILYYKMLSDEGKELLLERASELVKLGYIKSNEAGMVEEA